MGAKVDFLAPDSSKSGGTGGAATPGTRSAVRLPASAVKTDAGASVVWLVRDGRLVRRPVQTGPVSAGYLEVRSGLSGGEQVLVGGVETPAEGMRVKLP
jgi:membrane fusion protein (multidrug efflux system)